MARTSVFWAVCRSLDVPPLACHPLRTSWALPHTRHLPTGVNKGCVLGMGLGPVGSRLEVVGVGEGQRLCFRALPCPGCPPTGLFLGF